MPCDSVYDPTPVDSESPLPLLTGQLPCASAKQDACVAAKHMGAVEAIEGLRSESIHLLPAPNVGTNGQCFGFEAGGCEGDGVLVNIRQDDTHPKPCEAFAQSNAYAVRSSGNDRDLSGEAIEH